MNNESLVKSIRELCKKNNIAISQLEGDLNFGAGLISRWAKNSPSLDRIIDIANYFHVSLDEVVGHNKNLDDEFISKLYNLTDKKEIIWDKVTKDTSLYPEIKLYNVIEDEYPPQLYDEDNYGEIHYATKYNNGYIIIYAFYRYNSLLKPSVLKLFIQPTRESHLVEQEYYQNTLLSLWIKILYNLESNAVPDEIKAEEFKNAFMLNKSMTNSNDVLSGNLNKDPDTETIAKIASDPAVQQFMELYSKPEFQKMQQVITSPGFQAAIDAANKMQKYFDPGKK